MDLELQLRASEARRADLERQHQEALTVLAGCGPDTLEARQSRVRELEKKIALENVRCEELQLELTSNSRQTRGTSSTSAGLSNYSIHHQHPSSSSWSQTKGTEIEKIMAKIEQDNRILAELDHSRSTTLGPGLATSVSSHALGECCSPPISPILTMSHTTPSIYPTSTPLGGQQHHHHHSYNSGTLSNTGTSYITNPTSFINATPSTYNSLDQHYINTNKSLIGTTSSLTSSLPHRHHSLGIGQSGTGSVLNSLMQQQQQSSSVLGAASLSGGNVLGTSGVMVPSCITNFSTNSMGNNSSTFTNPLVPSNHNRILASTFNNPISSTLNQYHQYSNAIPIVTTSYSNVVTFSNPLSSHFNSLSGASMNIKLKGIEDVDIGQSRRSVATPVTPHPSPWTGTLGITDFRPRMLTDGLESDWSSGGGGGGGGGGATTLTGDRNFLNNGQPLSDGQVDMLDIPGKGRCSVYIARFSYEPELESEEELSILAGDYLLVWGEPMGPGSYLDAELLDGRRGLVPAHFVQRLIGDDLLEFHQAVLSTLREEEINQENFAADVARLNELAEMTEHQEDENTGPEVPAPRQLTLERQLNKSVLISWTTPENVGPGNQIESYHVYVDGVLKATVKATERTRALVEGVDSNRPHRISVRSVTANRRTSRDAACTMIIGRDTHQLGPSAVRASNITSTSAVISWLPANSNHQHVVCVNNVEVRTVKPGVYRHTITGLAPNTQYRVTVRAKHHRSAQNVANLAEELPMPAAAHTDFRTLPKGLPDPPSDILVEPGPQDGTLLVTWHPILAPHHPGSNVTGYAVYADGKKVTDVDSPTGDHALIDISKLLGLNPRHVTVRTKARDSQSADSIPTPIPASVLRSGGFSRRQQPHGAVMPAHLRQPIIPIRNQNNQSSGQQQIINQQQIIEPDENLSDKEIFPNSQTHLRQQQQQQSGIPSIAPRSLTEITKENYDPNLSEDELDARNRSCFNNRQTNHQPNNRQNQNSAVAQQNLSGGQNQQQQQYYTGAHRVIQNQQRSNLNQRTQQQQQQHQQLSQQQQHQMHSSSSPSINTNTRRQHQNSAPKYFVALFDYDPATMSPNPDACDEELPFTEGDTVKVWGEKDADGFYWGECHGKQGFVPHNMVMELNHNQQQQQQQQPNNPQQQLQQSQMRRMVALYDYDPQELSPNVDAEVELSFSTGQIITVFGEMDEDGFYSAQVNGVRGLVPSNFLVEYDEYAKGESQGRLPPARGVGPGARGPPPPPRENQLRGPQQQQIGQQNRSKDACNLLYNSSQLESSFNNTPASMSNTNNTSSEHQQARMRGMLRPGLGNQNQIQQQQQSQLQKQQFVPTISQNSSATTTTMGGLFSSLTGVGGGGGSSANNQQQQSSASQQQIVNQQNYASSNLINHQQQQTINTRIQHKGVPQVIPNINVNNLGNSGMMNNQNIQQPVGTSSGQNLPPSSGGSPNLMQKLNEITAPGGDILSKGKELIFMKFGLGGK